MSATSDVVKLKNVKLSFPELFRPRAFQEGQTPKFQATFLLDPSSKEGAAQIKMLKGKIKDVLVEAYGDEKSIPKGVKVCLKDNEEEGKEYNGYDGMWFISSSNTVRPTVVDRDLSPITEDDDKMYPGAIVNATITLWSQNNQYGKRVNANLRAIQFVKDSERFGGVAAANAENEFDLLDELDEADGDEPW